ncbi:MAG: peptidoglycan-binding protein [Leptolyngbya sp. SIOISBB]|nr:peptidoglycan-binding protein [Leptolyngbya sp. SIOISBB]
METSLQTLIQTLEPNGLSLGSYGRSVRSLQLVLSELQFYNGATDGYFGEETAVALQRLQRDFDLAETGDLNTATWYTLTFWALPQRRSATQTKVSPLGRSVANPSSLHTQSG